MGGLDTTDAAIPIPSSRVLRDASSRSVQFRRAHSGSTRAPSPPSLPAATVGASYAQSFSAGGGTAFNATYNTAYSQTFTGTGAPFTTTANYSLTVASATITVAPGTLSGGMVGVIYPASLSASGGIAPYSYGVTAGTLPPGLTLSGDGALSGRPTTSGSDNFTITATDSNGSTGSAGNTLSIAPSTAVPALGTGALVAFGLLLAQLGVARLRGV